MPQYDYDYSVNTDLYTSMFEQQYFNDINKAKVRPLKRKKKKNNNFRNFLRVCCLLGICWIMFSAFSYSFHNFVADVFPVKTKHPLKVDYYKLMFPTHSYLYKDLFLGKYPMKAVNTSKPIMVNINERYILNGLQNRLLQLAQNYPNITPSVYVWSYDSQGYVDIDADKIYPAASIIKIPVLIEMFRQIERNKFSLEDTMVLEDYYRASGSGKLQYSQGGIAHSMDYLAKIMIENSDNSSTNMIIAKMGGMPYVNREIQKWGIKNTRINNWLPDLDGTNITTARELGKMLYNLDKTDIVSVESKKHIADYLGHVKNNRLLQAGVPESATLLHKTGDIGYMLGDAGIVKTVGGKKYIVVILAKRPYNNQKGKEFIVEASKLIYNSLSI